MPTKAQIQIVQIARRQVGLNEPQYRMLLANVAGVMSTTELSNTQVEDVMDVLEGMGFIDSKHGEGYWGGKVQRRSQVANERMVRKIEAMADETKYPLGALVHRMSSKRTDKVEQLYPREAWNLIEALKDIVEREKNQTAVYAGALPLPVEEQAAADCPF